MFNMGKERTVSKGFVDKQTDRQAILPKRSFPKAEERYKQNSRGAPTTQVKI